MRIKKNPALTQDTRRTTLLDAVRAKTWVHLVKEALNLQTNYALAKVAGRQDQWRNYAAGSSVPNDDTLQKVESQLPGSMAWFQRGPADLALWPALDQETPDDGLEAIALISRNVDGKLAALHLDARRKTIPVEFPFEFAGSSEEPLLPSRWEDAPEEVKTDGFLYRLLAAHMDLLKILPDHLCEEIFDCGYQLLLPFRREAYQDANEWLRYMILDYYPHPDDRQRLMAEQLYYFVQSRTVKSKGTRPNAE